MGELLNSGAVYQHVNEATANLQDDTEALKHNFLLRGFFKKRGYEDAAELKQNAIADLPSTPPSKSFTLPAANLFDKPDGAKLKNAKMLDEAGRFLEQNPFSLAVVASYADMKGDTEKERQSRRLDPLSHGITWYSILSWTVPRASRPSAGASPGMPRMAARWR
jgi:hypothetical protein